MMKLLAALGVVALLGGASWVAWSVERAGSTSFPLILGGASVLVGVAAAVRAWRDGELVDWLAPAWGDFTRGFMGTAVLFAMAYAAVRTLIPAGSAKESWLARMYLQLGHPGNLRAHAGLVALGLLVYAASQELAWRGLVTGLVAELRGSRVAWIYASVLSAVAEAPTLWSLQDPLAGVNPVLPVGALVGGLVWGGMTRAFGGRLAPAILSHALFDWVLIMTFRLWGPSL